MATGTDPRNLESKVIPMQQALQIQKVYPMQPVVLMPLNPPEKDYLFLSIISLFFCILLAIPALLFSIKTREANLLGNQRKAQINSRWALAFSVSSILVGSTMIVCSIVLTSLRES
uniref:Uncharacterized protein n=1 Tax=Catagonus wagneri TaxID=51154 RepID=A0A8C3VVA6_9CETA